MKLAEIFQSGMTLQRRKPIKIWGESEKAEHLSIFWNGSEIWQGNIGPGPFSLHLPAMEAAENGTLSFSGGTILENVDIGEVWIAGGQSNMEFPLRCDRNWDAAQALAADDHFRFYDVGEFAFAGEREENLKPDAAHWDRWMSFDDENRGWFSAVGAWFGLELRKKLGVPVAVVGCNWGGTTASTWMDRQTLAADPELCVYLRDYEKATRNLNLEKYMAANREFREKSNTPQAAEMSLNMFRNEAVKKPGLMIKLFSALYGLTSSTGPHSENRPGGLYETMLPRVAGFSCSGVIWYQGEADEHHPEIYSKLFSAMISVWRRQWREELPFLFTQLAPFEAWMGSKGTQYPLLRQQQQLVEDTLPGAYMASIMDVGSRYDIHPKEKQPVGQRLALLALDKVYGISNDCAAPRITKVARSESGLVITFDHEMTAKGEFASLFTLTAKGMAIPCSAVLEGSRVNLTAHVPAEAELAFAYQPYCKMTLFGSNELPARPMAPTQI